MSEALVLVRDCCRTAASPRVYVVEFLLRKRYFRRGAPDRLSEQDFHPAEAQGWGLILQSAMATLLGSAHLTAGAALRLPSLQDHMAAEFTMILANAGQTKKYLTVEYHRDQKNVAGRK